MNSTPALKKLLQLFLCSAFLVSASSAFCATPDISTAGAFPSVYFLGKSGYLYTQTEKYAGTSLVKVPGLSDVKEVSGSIALKEDGTVWELLQICDATTVDESFLECKPLAPLLVGGLPKISKISSVEGSFRVALDEGGGVWVWGPTRFPDGALGDEYGITEQSLNTLLFHPKDYYSLKEKHLVATLSDNISDTYNYKHLSRSSPDVSLPLQFQAPKRVNIPEKILDITSNSYYILAKSISGDILMWGRFFASSLDFLQPPPGELRKTKDGRYYYSTPIPGNLDSTTLKNGGVASKGEIYFPASLKSPSIPLTAGEVTPFVAQNASLSKICAYSNGIRLRSARGETLEKKRTAQIILPSFISKTFFDGGICWALTTDFKVLKDYSNSNGSGQYLFFTDLNLL